MQKIVCCQDFPSCFVGAGSESLEGGFGSGGRVAECFRGGNGGAWLAVPVLRYMGSPEMEKITTLVVIFGTRVPFE